MNNYNQGPPLSGIGATSVCSSITIGGPNQKMSQIEQAFSELEGVVESSMKALSTLNVKLNPVLRQVPDSPNKSLPEDENPSTPMACRIKAIRRSLSSIYTTIESLNERVEI